MKRRNKLKWLSLAEWLKAFLRLLLRPISFLWESVYRLRRTFYNYGFIKRYQFKVPIISIGNLSFGGSGKTPFTLWLAKYLEKQNKKVVILMRGYKGLRENSSGLLRSGRVLGYNPEEYGDEAIIFAKNLNKASILIGKNRSQNLLDFFPTELPDVVLLDDGHQHLKMERDLNIVVFDAMLPLSSYQVAPLGYLREGLTALLDADFIIINRADLVPEVKIQALKNIINKYVVTGTPISQCRYVPKGLLDSRGHQFLAPDRCQGIKVVALAALASPDSFIKMLGNMGAEVVSTAVFPDHYFYSDEDILKVTNLAKEQNAIVVTTEKDIVKMRSMVDELEVYYLSVEVEFMDGEEKLLNLLFSVLNLPKNGQIPVQEKDPLVVT